MSPSSASAAQQLRAVLAAAKDARRCVLMPACHDAMSAVLIQRAGFEVAFMSGYAVSATQLALPDAGLISYGEQINIGRNICEATRGKLLVIGDGDFLSVPETSASPLSKKKKALSNSVNQTMI